MNQTKWLRAGCMGLGVTAVLIIALIASGLFDPKPIGDLVWTKVETLQTIPAQEQQITWLPDELPSGNFTLRATVAHQSGEGDSGAGIVLADDCAALIIAISPLGYATIAGAKQVEDELSCQTNVSPPASPLPWQPWPHVHMGDEPNEIWVDVEDGEMRVRLNRELLWVGDAPVQPTQVGLYVESFGETAVYHFPQLTLYTERQLPMTNDQ